MARTPALDDPLRAPLRFERLCLEKVWGGRRLEHALGLLLPGTGPIGETWEVVDRPGEASVVADGPLRGVTLGELVRTRRDDVLGRARATPEGRFPLLVKFIDASEPLSVQVHPPSGTRGRLGEGKTEAWYVLDARDDARFYLGLKPGTSRAALAAAAPRRDVLDHVRTWPARRGELVYVPGGTVHAIGAGIAILEVQENADTTHRLYDWDRLGLDGKPRAIHVDAALDSTDFESATEGPRPARPTTRAPGVRVHAALDAASFSFEAFELEVPLALDTDGLATIHVVLGGAGRLEAPGRAPTALERGQTWFLPAAVGPYHVVPNTPHEHGPLAIVRITTRP